MMIRNHLLLLLRQFRKNRFTLMVNLGGLTIGLTCAILALMYMVNEYSFDQFHKKKENIVRLYKKNVSINDGTQTLTAETSGMMGPTLVDEYPVFTSFVRILPWFDEAVISYDDNHQKTPLAIFADSTFFQVFSFRLLRGDPASVLTMPSSVVLSESMARRLFGEEDPVGKTVIGLHDLEYQVTGVAEDPPVHSHIQYDLLISWSTTVPDHGPLGYTFMNNWLGQTVFTYLETTSGADLKETEASMTAFMERHFPERAKSYFLRFQNFSDIYMGSENIMYGRQLRLGNPKYTYAFSLAALFVLLIACVNYVNIQTARSARRSAEIGIRKVMGAARKQLIRQFLGEAAFLVILAAAFAILLVDLLLPAFNQLSGGFVEGSLVTHPAVMAGISVILLVTILLAGIYPAWLLSGYSPAAAMKPAASVSRGVFSRKLLLTVQYIISTILIICAIVVVTQTRYMREKPLGFEKDQLVIMNINNGIDQRRDEFISRLKEDPGVQDIAVSQAAVGTGWFGTTIIPEGKEDPLSVSVFRIGANFIQVMGIEMTAGRAFREGSPSDSASVVINEAMAELLGYEDPLGHSIRFGPDDTPRPIIGVVKNFHYEGINEGVIRPLVMYLYDRNFYNLTIRISGVNVPATIAHMQKTWEQFEDRYPFDYYFASQWYDDKYRKEGQLLSTVAIFSGISIMLAFLGLYGLTSFTLQQRLKEFSIRKVLGASEVGLTLSANRSTVIMVCLACLIGMPVARYLMQDWLNDFAYQADITLWVYPVAGGVVLGLTVLAVSLQAWKSARTNPSEILRSE